MKTANDNSIFHPLNSPVGMAVLLCLFFPPLATFAETIEAKLPSGITAFASFQSGSPAQTAVLFLHGLQQTHQSRPFNALADNLAAQGYAVLNPTLSMGVNQRAQSMACEAVHTHTMEQDVAEIAYWANWLINKGYKNISLIGFSSTGNIQAMLYNSQNQNPAVKKTILVSMNPVLIDQKERKKTQGLLKASSTSEKNKLGRYSVGYCKNNFVSRPGIYMTYAPYDETGILQLLAKTHGNTELIFGSEDFILPANWISRIKTVKSPTEISIIDKANHFFEGTHEFDLAEKIEAILKAIPQ